MNREMWQSQIDHLQDFHCLNVDLPGHGKSQHERWISLADTADQLADIIRSRATNGKAHIVGLSLGACLGLVLMARHPQLIDRAILSGTTILPMPNVGVYKFITGIMAMGLKSGITGALYARMMQIPPDSRADFERVMKMTDPAALRRINEEVLIFTLPDGAAAAPIPTLCVVGDQDMPIFMDSLPLLIKNLPGAEARLAPGVHHGWNGEAPDLFNAMVRAWLTEKPLPEGLVVPAFAAGELV